MCSWGRVCKGVQAMMKGVTEVGFIGLHRPWGGVRLYLSVLGCHGRVWNKGRTGSDFFLPEATIYLVNEQTKKYSQFTAVIYVHFSFLLSLLRLNSLNLIIYEKIF